MEVEKFSNYLERGKLYGVSLRSVEKYGRHRPDNIYVTGFFAKTKDKAFDLAWKEFYKAKDRQDREDRRVESSETEIVTI